MSDSSREPPVLPPDSGEPSDAGTGVPKRRRPAWCWWIHLIVLGSYPVVLGVLSAMLAPSAEDAVPPLRPEVGAIVATTADALIGFGIFFLIAWLASRATAAQLLLRANSWPKTIAWGAVLSVALRVLILVPVLIFYVVSLAVGAGEEDAERLRPQTELLVDIQGLADSPLFLLTCMTLISFVVAGLREELWRAGVLAALAVLAPRWNATVTGRLALVTIIAVLFGVGHLPAGWGAVLLTTILGFGLGVIMIWRKSIWEAVLAHGFFDASTFFLLYVIAKYFPNALDRIMGGLGFVVGAGSAVV